MGSLKLVEIGPTPLVDSGLVGHHGCRDSTFQERTYFAHDRWGRSSDDGTIGQMNPQIAFENGIEVGGLVAQGEKGIVGNRQVLPEVVEPLQIVGRHLRKQFGSDQRGFRRKLNRPPLLVGPTHLPQTHQAEKHVGNHHRPATDP